MTPRLACALVALGATLSFAAPRAFAAVPIDTPHVVQLGALGVDVTVRYRMLPPAHPEAAFDPGPYLGSGTVGITAGPARANTVVPFAALDALAPNLKQIVPSNSRDGCGVNGPIAIEKLSDSAFPAVVVNTVVIVKGCLAIAHVFVPLGATSATYALVTSYDVGHPLHPFLGAGRFIPPHADGSLRVSRVRRIVVPAPPANAGLDIADWTIAIVDGTDGRGKQATIALDRPKVDEVPDVGETLSIFKTPNAHLMPEIHLSPEHEARYQRLHA